MIPVEIYDKSLKQFVESHINAFHIVQSSPMVEGYFTVILTNGNKHKCKGKYNLFLSRMKAVLKG